MGNITCKYCGKTGLRWSLTKKNPVTDKPLLVDLNGLAHSCMGRLNKLPDVNEEQSKLVEKIMEERQRKLAEEAKSPLYQYRNQPRIMPQGMPQNIEQKIREEERRRKEEQRQKEEEEKREEKKRKEEEERAEREKPWSGKHFMQDDLKIRLEAGLNVLVVGPAGGGKSHGAYLIAKELGWNFYPQSLGPQTSESKLMGYETGGDGSVIWAPLRKAYTYGGLWCGDEIDASNPGVLTIINAILSNEVCSFPGALEGVPRHPMFRCVACANTYGQGATRTYVGRQPLDGATTDRFVGLDWGYDEKMEEHFCKDQPDWLLYVWALRKAAIKLDIKRILGTRKIMQGRTLLNIGVPLERVKNETVFFGISPDERKRLEANLG